MDGCFERSAETVIRISKPKESTADILGVAQPYLKETHFNAERAKVAAERREIILCESPRFSAASALKKFRPPG
jgi:hypothetical protein